MRVGRRAPGFTLIELLVVIAIIGVLSTVGIVRLNGGQGKARDAGRITNMRVIVQALQLYHDDHGAWPWEDGTNMVHTSGQPFCPPQGPSQTTCRSYNVCWQVHVDKTPVDPNWFEILSPYFSTGETPRDPSQRTCKTNVVPSPSQYPYRYEYTSADNGTGYSDFFQLQYYLERKADKNAIGVFLSCESGIEQCWYIIYGTPDGNITL